MSTLFLLSILFIVILKSLSSEEYIFHVLQACYYYSWLFYSHFIYIFQISFKIFHQNLNFVFDFIKIPSL